MPNITQPSNQMALASGLSFTDEDNQLESHLIAQVNEWIRQYSWLFQPETLDLARHDIAQEARVRFWERAKIHEIRHPKAYLAKIVRNMVTDLARKYEAILPLPLDDHGELYQGRMIIVASESLQDPSQQILQEEGELANIQMLVDFILKLPRRQREAMLCLLKPLTFDVYVFEHTLQEAIRIYNQKAVEMHEKDSTKTCEVINLEEIAWPTDARQNRRLRSSLNIARKKLEKYLGENTSDSGNITSLTGMQAYGRKERLLREEQQRQREKLLRLKRQAKNRSKKRQEQLQEQKAKLIGILISKKVPLPELYQTVLQAHYIEECSFAEMAARFQVPEGTIKARVHRGAQMLLQGIQTDQNDNPQGDPETLRALFTIHYHEFTEPYQTTVFLYYVRCLPYPEIARTQEISINTVKSRLSRARKLLLTGGVSTPTQRVSNG